MAVQRRYVTLGSFGVLAGVAVVAGPALACTSSAKIQTTAVTAPVGGVVTVNGSGFNSSNSSTIDGPVEIRWNSLSGTPIASSAGGSFSVQVTIPSANPGFYYITAVQRSKADGRVSWKSSVPIEVVGTTTAAPPAPVPVVVTPATPPVVVAPPEPTTVTPQLVEPATSTAMPPAVVEPIAPSGVEESASSTLTPPVISPVEQPVSAGPVVDPVVAPVGSGPVVEPVGSGPLLEQVGSVDAPAGPALAPRSGGVGGAPQVGNPQTSSAQVPSRSSSSGPVGAAVGSAGRLIGGAGGLPRLLQPVVAGQPSLAQVPAQAAKPWNRIETSEPAPSLFEPVEGDEARRAAGAPVGAGLMGLGLMAIVGVGVVAGQRRRVLVVPTRR